MKRKIQDQDKLMKRFKKKHTKLETDNFPRDTKKC